MQGWMKRYVDIIIFYREALFYMGLLIWIAIGFNSDQHPASWEYFFKTTGAGSIVMIPVIAFAAGKPHLRTHLTKRQFLLCWLLFFGAVFPLISYFAAESGVAGYPGWLFTTCFICGISLELLLLANEYYRQKVARAKWVRELGLGKAILIILVIISVALAAMAVSSIDDPRFHKNGQLLIGFVFVPSKLVGHFGTFLSLLLQFFIMYLAGYVFFIINSRLLIGIILKKYGLVIYLCSMLTVTVFLYPPLAQLLTSLPIRHLLGAIFSSDPFAGEHAAAAIAIMILSLPVLLSQQWNRQNSQIVLLEKEKAQAELDLLKQQVNPHFLFNTLNNLYSLSLHHSDKTPESILQLSDLMRYVIYKGREEKVALKDELKYIEDFIDLQIIRLRQPLDLRFEKNDINPEIKIAPLLLIVFVENAFKHGVEPAEKPAMLHLTLSQNGPLLTFNSVNSVEPAEEKESGIGLSNLAKRLELLYPDRHILHTEVKNHTFIAELQIDLS